MQLLEVSHRLAVDHQLLLILVPIATHRLQLVDGWQHLVAAHHRFVDGRHHLATAHHRFIDGRQHLAAHHHRLA